MEITEKICRETLLSKYELQNFEVICFLSGFMFKVQLEVPVVVRLEGTNVDQGKRILKVNVELNLISNLFC